MCVLHVLFTLHSRCCGFDLCHKYFFVFVFVFVFRADDASTAASELTRTCAVQVLRYFEEQAAHDACIVNRVPLVHAMLQVTGRVDPVS